MNHKYIVADYSDIALESIIRDLASTALYGPARDWAYKRLSAARAELRKRELKYNKTLK